MMLKNGFILLVIASALASTNFTLENIIDKYCSLTPSSISGFDKDFVFKQSVGLLTINGELSLRNCKLRGLDIIDSYLESKDNDWWAKLTFEDIKIDCNANIHRLNKTFNANIHVECANIDVRLEIIQHMNESSVKIEYERINALNVTTVLRDIHNLPTSLNENLEKYFREVISDNLEQQLSSNLKKVAEELSTP